MNKLIIVAIQKGWLSRTKYWVRIAGCDEWLTVNQYFTLVAELEEIKYE